MKPTEEVFGTWKRPSQQPVNLVSHATHLEYVPKMISAIRDTDFSDKAFAQIRFTPRSPHRNINGLKVEECKLLYFAWSAWSSLGDGLPIWICLISGGAVNTFGVFQESCWSRVGILLSWNRCLQRRVFA